MIFLKDVNAARQKKIGEGSGETHGSLSPGKVTSGPRHAGQGKEDNEKKWTRDDSGIG